ncbi:MAG: LamGL protein, partial [Candidatus Hydrogenedentes bacterium]|nr:LamGL protein [Candidatus Hydrogenedentota bacterium]
MNRTILLVSFCLGLACGAGADSPATGEGETAPHLLACYPFDEPAEALLFGDAASRGARPAQTPRPVLRRRGVWGSALELRGEHALAVEGWTLDNLPGLTVAAWVRPSDVGGFREIFRQECDNRVLFSFQESGTILSLGLNVNGYVECDARIAPRRVMDGAWHLCAGTFDGQTMRVYLDGREIGSMDRPGTIALTPGVPMFIGSSGGTNEHFQGGLDDLRLYAEALPATEIDALFKEGLAAIAETARTLDEAAARLYAEASTFAESVANTRRNLVEKGGAPDVDVTDAIYARLRGAFPDECGDLLAWTGLTPLECLSADDSVYADQVQRLIGLMNEYKPLTEYQKSKETPEERQQWEEADRIQERFEALTAQGGAARFSPEWVALMLDAGRRIVFRPYVNEAVAPYVKPETPLTRDLNEDEAHDALERDWMYQADGNPAPQRIRDEIAWARALAARIPGDHAAQLAQLDAYDRQAEQLSGPDKALYLNVRAVKRAIMFQTPALDFDKILLVDMSYPQGSEWPHETRHRLGYMAVPGGRLLVLEGLHPGGKVTQLMPKPPLHGSFWRPDVSFDGQKVLFCFKPHNEKSFHLYEIGVDGSGLTQLTDGIYDDVDPIYLPDGHVMFPTTRGHNYVRCMPPTNSFELARADGDGQNIYLISYSNEPDYLPSVMDDGRVIYTRWEYTDKPLWRAQKLWTTHPDGTQVVTYWGNQSVWPDVMKDARNIPGSRRVMFTGSAHHNWFAGSVGIIDPDKGFNFPDGLTKVTADVEWPECGNGPEDPVESPSYHASGKYPAYYSPYPLSEQEFLVSAQRDDKFRLYLMDVDGNRELVYEGINNVFHAMPLKPRP